MPETEEKPKAKTVDPTTPVITFGLSLERLRLIGSKINREREFGQKEAQAFLDLYGKDIEARLVSTIKDFLTEKLA